jgi:hypothetical protein
VAGDDRERQSREALDRVARETHGVLGSAMGRAADHFAGRDAAREAPSDGVELWGRRIGRALGAVFFVLLIVNLFTGWIL